VTLFKRRKRQKLDEQALQAPLVLKSEQSPCTCPEPCERDHGNE
jgi:hypothetical protein